MTPTATYIAEENCLQELPRRSVPVQGDDKYKMLDGTYGTFAHHQYNEDLKAYNAHLATLRKIPCDISCKGLWADGQKVVAGKDYEVRDYPIRAMLPTDPKFIAFPLVPAGEDEEKKMWMDAITLAMNALADDPFTPGKWLEVVKSKYSLTKR